MNNAKNQTPKEWRTGKMILLAIAGVLAAGFLLLPSALLAQGGGMAKSTPQATTRQAITDQEIQLMRQDVRSERRQIVAANLPLTTEESAKFWPVYDQYMAEEAKINDARFELIKDYAANYTTMTDAHAATYIRKTIEVDKAILDLRLKYMPMIEKVLSERKSAIFAQIDRRVRLMLDLQLASQIPLISPK